MKKTNSKRDETFSNGKRMWIPNKGEGKKERGRFVGKIRLFWPSSMKNGKLKGSWE